MLKTNRRTGKPRISSNSNAWSEWITANNSTTSRTGVIAGMTIRSIVFWVLAPEMRAASSRVESMVRKAGVSSITWTAIAPLARWAQTMPQKE